MNFIGVIAAALIAMKIGAVGDFSWGWPISLMLANSVLYLIKHANE